MLKQHSRESSSVTIAGVVALTLGLVPASFADLVPGGGPARSDCYIELDVTGATKVTKKRNDDRGLRRRRPHLRTAMGP
jgi:hypothetical protein